MTLQDTFYLGTTIEDIETLESLGIVTDSGDPYDPDADYQPFSVVDKLGDLSSEGNGFPIVTWHWAAMKPGDADILFDFLGSNISAPVVFRTRLNRLNGGATDYLWQTFGGIMSWGFGPEQNPALHTLDLTITFTGLVAIEDYP